MKELDIQPSGIHYQPNLITAAEEEKLIEIFRHQLVWPESRGRVSLHYGYTFDYKTFGVDLNIPFIPFPEWLTPLLLLSHQREGRPPDQVCLQYYPPGTGIPPHVDTHSAFDQLYAVSLGSPVFMQFANPVTKEKVDLDLEPRSLMQMSGASRLHWTHGIRQRKTDTLNDGEVRRRGDRWSLTYRWIRKGGVCGCGDEGLCDTAKRERGVETAFRWKSYGKEEEEGKEDKGDH